MRRIESITDEMNRVVTFEIGRQRVVVDQLAIEQIGITGVMKNLRSMGYDVPSSSDLVAVYQCDRHIGMLPGNFDPVLTRSVSIMYDIRRGDFTRSERGWEAHPSICPGDFDCIPGFTRAKMTS